MARVHVGVDLHKRMSQIAVLTDDGELAQHRLANDTAGLKQFFAALPPRPPVAIEASGTSWWLVDLLEDLGHQPVLSHSKQTKAIRGLDLPRPSRAGAGPRPSAPEGGPVTNEPRRRFCRFCRAGPRAPGLFSRDQPSGV